MQFFVKKINKITFSGFGKIKNKSKLQLYVNYYLKMLDIVFK